jgi:hypothetical protein
MGPTLGKLPEHLRAFGVTPEEIAPVFLTHIHPDHSNGLVDDTGRAVFPNAELILHEAEARFWLDREQASGETERIRRNIAKAAVATAPYRSRHAPCKPSREETMRGARADGPSSDFWRNPFYLRAKGRQTRCLAPRIGLGRRDIPRCSALRSRSIPVLCYCTDCQKASGSGFIPFMGFASSAVRFSGRTQQYTTKAANGRDAVRNSCPVCGSLVFGGVVGKDSSFTIYAGTLDDPSSFHPTAAIFTRSRAAWAVIPPGLTIYDAMAQGPDRRGWS